MALNKFCCSFFSCFTSPDGPEDTAHPSGTAGSPAPAPLKGDDSSSTVPNVPDFTEDVKAEAVEGKVDQVAASSSMSSSSTVPNVSELTKSIRNAVSADAVDGKEVKVDLAGLMEYISKLLEIRKKKSPLKNLGAHNFWPTTSTGLLNIKEFLSGGIELASSIKEIIPSEGSSLAKTVVVNLLKGIGHASLATAGLLVIANILERFEDVKENDEACLSLLDEMNTLAKYVKQLQEDPRLEKQMEHPIRKATELIVEASILCCTQIDSSKFGSFFLTSVNKKELSEFKEDLNSTYRDMHTQMLMCIFRAFPGRPTTVRTDYPTDAVGLDKPVEKIIQLLDWKSNKKAIAVVVHGFGGMGKTTLANAVYATMFDGNNKEGCKYCKIRLFDDINSTVDIMKSQKYIIKDLRPGTEQEEKDIRMFEDGQGEIRRLLEQEVALIYIDNVLCGDEREQVPDALEKLLPKNMWRAKKVRFLITARDKDALSTSVFKDRGLEAIFYDIKVLPDPQAMELLEKKLHDNITTSQKDELVQVCGGIPKLLTVVAGFISDGEDAHEAYKTVMEERKKHWKGQTKIGKEIDYVFAYEKLPETLKDPFLDICSFFQGWDWETLSDVVGGPGLERLEKRSLVTRDMKSKTVRVHDVILTIGQRNSKGSRFRITNATDFEEFLDQKEDKEIREIKGIWFTVNTDTLTIDAETLDWMSSSLRVLQLGTTVVKGKCEKIFKKLVFFKAEISRLPFDMSKLNKFEALTYLCYNPEDLLDLSQMPSSLRHIQFTFASHSMNSRAFQISSECLQQMSNLRELSLFNALLERLPQELPKHSSLQELNLEGCERLEALPSTLGKLSALQELNLSLCLRLEALPSSLGELSSLQELNLEWCERLEALPSTLGKLSALQELNLSRCLRLEALPSSLGELSSLQELNLECCRRLKALPSTIGELSSLQELNLSDCERLEALPSTLGKLSALQKLNLFGCKRLEALPSSLGELSSLQELNLSYCKRLEELPSTLGELSSLRLLNLLTCESLKDLPYDIGKLSSLEVLGLYDCKELSSLPESIGQLKSLNSLMNLSGTGLKELPDGFCYLSFITNLKMNSSHCLKKLPESFGQLKYLEHLDLSNCIILEELCIDFKGLSSLRVLSLDSCKMLKKLPEDFHCLISLAFLGLDDCGTLDGKWMDSIVKIKTLQTVTIRKSPMLEERWEEIRRQGDQYPWSFAVHTGEGSKDYIPIKQLHSEFESILKSILSNGRLFDRPPNTLVLVMYDGFEEFLDGFPLSLIEENIDDIQTNFEMIYFGNHFDNLPKKMAGRILDHAPANSNAQSLFQIVLAATGVEGLRNIDWLLSIQFQMSVKIVSDEKDDKYLSGWEMLSERASVEELVIKNCGRYLKLKQLVETPRESNTKLLRELFASGEEESSCLGFLKSDASVKVGVAELKGKTILLDIRPSIMCSDIPLQSLKELYLAEKERLDFEIITIPIMQESTESDFLEQLSKQVPWLVLQNPGQLTSVTKFFLVEDCLGWLREPSWEIGRDWDRWYHGIMRVIESNGTIAAYNPGVLRMVNTWGVEAYPFTEEKSKELKEKERHQMEAMSNLTLLFRHLGSLADQVKASMVNGKMIFFCTGEKGSTVTLENELAELLSDNNELAELSDKVQIIYIPQFGQKDSRYIHYTNELMSRGFLEKVETPQVEIQGMDVLNLSEHEAMRFWAGIFSLKECIDGMDDDDKQLDGIRNFLKFIGYGYSSILAIMDEDGDFIPKYKARRIARTMVQRAVTMRL